MSSKSIFVVSAKPRSTTQEPVTFLVEADTHRDAWFVARRACSTGDGALVRDPQTLSLEPRSIAPAAYTVDRVLSSAPQRRGRPPKLTVSDLFARAEELGTKIPPRVRRVIDELEHEQAS
jgi:hypothetical protein